MFSRTFRGGAHPATEKRLTQGMPIQRMRPPRTAVIPLHQHAGACCKPAVSVGDTVQLGAVIGTSDAVISAPVHASISGKVTRIADFVHPVLGKVVSIFIESAGDEPHTGADAFPLHAEARSKESLLAAIKEAGIVGLGGAAFPTHVKLAPPANKPIDCLILNGAECEPFLTCDYRLMLEHADEIIKGLDIIARILGSRNIAIAVEDNKQDAARAIRRSLKNAPEEVSGARVLEVRTKYPQGAEKQLIRSVTGRIVPAGKLPLEVGCVVQNVGTAFAVYEAVYRAKPLIERCVTVSGDCVNQPKNLWVRIGTPLKDVIDACGGFDREPAKIIFGGPMMGIAQFSMDVPVVKGTSGILFFSPKMVTADRETVCIRCGRCVDTCPMDLVPTALMHYAKKERFQDAVDSGVAHCIECGICAYVCPAKIPLVDYMKLGKAKVPLCNP